MSALNTVDNPKDPIIAGGENLKDVLNETSKEIKMLNYEIKRVIASEDEAFVKFDHDK